MKVLLASINCQKTGIEKNLETHKKTIREAADADCDLAVFPKMSLTGYLDPAIHADDCLPLDSSHIEELVKYGDSLSVDLLFGVAERSSAEIFFVTQIHAST